MDKSLIQNHFRSRYNQFYEKYLPNLKKAGTHQYKSLCPFHEEKDASFNINSEDGTYFCHGCGKKGNAFHFYAKTHQLDDRYHFPKILKGIASDFGITSTEQERKVVKTYDYVDQQGNLLFQVCRYEPKDFRARRPDGKGGWIENLDGVKRVPYRLPELIKAETACVVEGEKDADSLHMLGFVATTFPLGSRSYRSEYSEYLEGKNIVLFPDNDIAGREYMLKIASCVNGGSRSLKWVDLPGLPDKGDVTDFIIKFQDPLEAKEEILGLIEQAPLYTPPQKKTIEDIIVTIQDFHDLEFPRRAYHLYPWFKEQEIILIAGERGLGKSFFGHSIANAISTGTSCGPWECKLSGPILLVDGEMTVNDLQERFEMMGLNQGGLSPFYLYSDALANQNGISRAHLVNEAWREKVKSIIMARHIKILILDNLASLAYGLDENVKKDWDPINQWLIDLRFLGVSTIMEHHTGKAGSQRGTSAREDNLDISILLKRPGDYVPEDGCRFVVSFSKARVSQEALSLIGDTEFQLIQGEGGKYEFQTKNIRRAVKEEILRMLAEGVKQSEIAEALHVNRSYVNRLAKGVQK
ncbi:MAG: AAA family ATPase [bacterium]